jgi:hypothetical protein
MPAGCQAPWACPVITPISGHRPGLKCSLSSTHLLLWVGAEPGLGTCPHP